MKTDADEQLSNDFSAEYVFFSAMGPSRINVSSYFYPVQFFHKLNRPCGQRHINSTTYLIGALTVAGRFRYGIN